MPDLAHSLHGHDLGYLRIVAELWGIDLKSKDEDGAVKELSGALHDPSLLAEQLAALKPEARAALEALAEAGGKLSWAAFARRFGPIREVGAGKRDREKPYLNPASAAEMLFYRALLFQAFFETANGAQEFAYIPDDLLSLIPRKETGQKLPSHRMKTEPIGRGATPGEKKYAVPASGRVLDDATTLLAALRLGRSVEPDPKLFALLRAAGLISTPRATTKGTAKPKSGVEIRADKVKAFLEAPRPEALQRLVEAWEASESFNELRLLPGLLFEGQWENQPRQTRGFLLDLVHDLPDDAWWSLKAFIGEIKKKYPDFQRPAGDYDSWFIQRADDGSYLRGFAYWDQVDGALVRFFITDILHWLGMLDLATAEQGGEVTAFHAAAPRPKQEERGKISVASTGKLIVSRSTPRAIRYQISRFCDWDEEKPDQYLYHITPRSLAQAREQGLKVEHLLALLSKHAEAGMPPVLVRALQRWEQNGTEAHAGSEVVLRVSRPEILEELRKSKAAKFLGEPLGPTSVIVKAGARAKVIAALAEMGILAEDS